MLNSVVGLVLAGVAIVVVAGGSFIMRPLPHVFLLVLHQAVDMNKRSQTSGEEQYFLYSDPRYEGCME